MLTAIFHALPAGMEVPLVAPLVPPMEEAEDTGPEQAAVDTAQAAPETAEQNQA